LNRNGVVRKARRGVCRHGYVEGFAPPQTFRDDPFVFVFVGVLEMRKWR
jgi:hypothetical protein